MELEKFKRLVIPLRDTLQNVARKMLQDEVDAEDAVQETFLKLWNIRSQLDKHPNVGGFTMQTLKNVCIDKLRSRRHNIFLDSNFIPEVDKTPYAYTEQNDNIEIVRRIINSLPETQRRIMLMRDIEGYELSEIAEIIGTEESAVRVNLSRARKTVRNKFASINNIRI